jgi:molybdate transport system regulatory protein
MSTPTSARNQLAGTVTNVRKGAVNAEVELEISGGATLVAQVTLPSVESLGLVPGRKATALLKSSWMLLGTGEAEPRVSARNRLKGTILVVSKGAVNAEVSLKIAGGAVLVATVTNTSAEALDLKPDATVWALFKAGAVILAV